MKFVRKITRDLFEPKADISQRRVVVDRESGTIAARIYSFGEVHSGRNVKAPRNVNITANIGDVDLEDGTTLKAGSLPMGTLHAGETLTAAQAAKFYEDTGTQIARGRYSQDDIGVRFDGVLHEDISESDLDRLTASAPSGDWRWKAMTMLRKPSDMEMAPCDFVGSCLVNIPGFSGEYTNAPMTPMRLIASADSDEMVLTDLEEIDMPEDEKQTCGDGVCCGGACKDVPAGEGPAEKAPDRESLVAAAALLAEHAGELGLDEDTAASLTAAASSQADTSGDSLAKVREDLNSLAQILHDAIMSL